MLFLSILAVFVSLFSFTPSPAYAQENGTISVSPAYLDVALEKPEEEKEVEITYKNNSNAPIELEFFAIDFRQSDIAGSIRFIEEKGAYSYSLVSFLQFETNTLQLEPKEKKSTKVRLTNRFNLSPGGHYAAVIARQVSKSSEERTGTKISPGLSTLIYLRKIGGERFNLSIKEIERFGSSIVFGFPTKFNITFQNDGNVHLTPYGTILVKDLFGRQIYQGSINEESIKVMPESRRYIKGYLMKSSYLLPVSVNTIEIAGSDSLKKTNYVYQSTFLYMNPAFVIIVLIVFSAILFMVLKKIIRKRKNNK